MVNTGSAGAEPTLGSVIGLAAVAFHTMDCETSRYQNGSSASSDSVNVAMAGALATGMSEFGTTLMYRLGMSSTRTNLCVTPPVGSSASASASMASRTRD